MEYVKLESNDGIRTPVPSKLNPLEPRGTHKSTNSSAGKAKLRTPSVSKKGKPHYLLNKKNKETSTRQLQKVATSTKFSTTAILSGMSTPNNKSL